MASSAFYQAFVEIVPESKNLRRTLSKEFDSAGTVAGTKASKGINSGILGGIGRLAGPLAIAFAGLGIGKLLSESITSASDLAEAGTAVEAIFGPAYESIATFAEGADKALGQSNLEALNAAKSFGIFGTAAGLSSDANAEFSIGLTTLATDLASFNNTTPEAAIEAIGAALRGESEPLRQYGILLDDATLRAKALELGIYDGSGALTQQQRILAAESVIYDQAGVAVGDFTKTSEGLANQQRILSAQFENSKAKLGEALLPAMTTFANFANTTLIPALNTLIEQVGPLLSGAMAEAGPGFSELLTALVPLIPPLTELAVSALPVIVDLLILLGPIISAVAGFLTVFFGLVAAISSYLQGDTGWATLRDNVESIGGPFGALFSIAQQVGFGLGVIIGNIVRAVVKFAGETKANINKVITFFTELPGKVIAAVVSFGTLLFDTGKNLVQGLLNGINDVAGGIVDSVLGPVKDAVAGVKNFLGIKSPSRLMFGVGANTGEGLILGVQSKIAGAGAAMQSLVSVPNVSARIDAGVYGSGSAPASSGPSELVIVDADRKLIGRMRVEAQSALFTSENSRELNVLRGRQV